MVLSAEDLSYMRSALAQLRGKVSYFAYGSPGAEVDMSSLVDVVRVGRGAEKHANTPVQAAEEASEPGVKATVIRLRGPWSEAADAQLEPLLAATGKQAIWGPDGSSAGKRKYVYSSCYLREYRHIGPPAGIVYWEAEIVVAGDVVRMTF